MFDVVILPRGVRDVSRYAYYNIKNFFPFDMKSYSALINIQIPFLA